MFIGVKLCNQQGGEGGSTILTRHKIPKIVFFETRFSHVENIDF